jgi:ABC-2 type transport system permease protein
MIGVSNILAVARRELLIRIRTRSFLIGTLLLAGGVAVIAFLPVIISHLDRTSTTKVAVVAEEPALATQAQSTITSLFNAPSTGTATDPGAKPDMTVSVMGDLAAARAEAASGSIEGVLSITRNPDDSLSFTYYSNSGATGQTASQVHLAADSIAIGDRLNRRGVSPADQAALFAPAQVTVAWADPARTEPVADVTATVGRDILAFGMTVLIFMIVIMYGNWVAMSVVEEKSSRVMEVVLNAATPVQLLAGKVFGVGIVAFLQYAAVILAGVVSLALQPTVAEQVLGGQAASLLPQGLTLELLIAFGVFGVLGFLLYAALYAAAGSLVSRMEDVNAAVMPLTLLSMAGYLVGVYASTGLLDGRSPLIGALSLIPFLSPFMMLGRASTGVAQPWEVALSIALLLLAIGVAIWVAARIYAVGVLLYGQRPGAKAVWRLLREGM